MAQPTPEYKRVLLPDFGMSLSIPEAWHHLTKDESFDGVHVFNSMHPGQPDASVEESNVLTVGMLRFRNKKSIEYLQRTALSTVATERPGSLMRPLDKHIIVADTDVSTAYIRSFEMRDPNLPKSVIACGYAVPWLNAVANVYFETPTKALPNTQEIGKTILASISFNP